MHFGPSEDVRDKLIRTCYPSAITDADAQPVVVSSAEVGPIEIRLQRNRTFRITGMAIDSSGAPIANPSVNLVSVTPTGSSSSSSSIQTKPGGQFIASGVTPGDYAIQVSTGRLAFPQSRGQTGSRDGLRAGARRYRGHRRTRRGDLEAGESRRPDCLRGRGAGTGTIEAVGDDNARRHVRHAGA